MSAPNYDSSKTPVKNLQALARALGLPAIADTFEVVITQILLRLHAAALALSGTLSVAGASTLAGAVTLGNILVGSVDTKSGAGAISVTALTTKLTTTGEDALTLADGVEGQLKRIVMVADGGDGTLTPATKTGFSTIVFDAVGESVLLQFHATLGWMVVANNGATIE